MLKVAVTCTAAQTAHWLADYFTDKMLYGSSEKIISKYDFILKFKHSSEGYFELKTEVHILTH